MSGGSSVDAKSGALSKRVMRSHTVRPVAGKIIGRRRSMRYRQSLLLFVACCAGTALAQTQPVNYPVKPVRLILGPGPGSVADGLTRVMAAALTELWGQQVIV